MPTDQTTDTVPLFRRYVPVPALTLLLRLENDGYDLRVDAQTRELCITPPLPPQQPPTLTQGLPMPARVTWRRGARRGVGMFPSVLSPDGSR